MLYCFAICVCEGRSKIDEKGKENMPRIYILLLLYTSDILGCIRQRILIFNVDYWDTGQITIFCL